MNEKLTPEWLKVPESLPPPEGPTTWSGTVWLALSDGQVVRGSCLHKSEDETYAAPDPAWFIEIVGKRWGIGAWSLRSGVEVTVLAWLPIEKPDFPKHLSVDKQQSLLRETLEVLKQSRPINQSSVLHYNKRVAAIAALEDALKEPKCPQT